MKKFKKVFIPFVIFGIIFVIFDFIVYPMINASNTILNMIGFMLGFITGFFAYSYVGVLTKNILNRK
jgi:fucose 4-O-acetylase-like acetyltransferase